MVTERHFGDDDKGYKAFTKQLKAEGFITSNSPPISTAEDSIKRKLRKVFSERDDLTAFVVYLGGTMRWYFKSADVTRYFSE